MDLGAEPPGKHVDVNANDIVFVIMFFAFAKINVTLIAVRVGFRGIAPKKIFLFVLRLLHF